MHCLVVNSVIAEIGLTINLETIFFTTQPYYSLTINVFSYYSIRLYQPDEFIQ